MMDWSPVIDAGMVVACAIALLLLTLWTLSADSNTVSSFGSLIPAH